MTVLYLSYDGALEPLGQSQVVAYLERLAARYAITLISFEKSDDLADGARIEALERRLTAAGIRWRAVRYHKRPPVLSTAWDVVHGILVAVREGRRRRVTVVHARGYVAALVALAVRRFTGARFIFDMRGFWPDEKVDAGHWRAGSLLYRVAKHCERRFFESADAIVCWRRSLPRSRLHSAAGSRRRGDTDLHESPSLCARSAGPRPRGAVGNP
jgi:hypothetical protein